MTKPIAEAVRIAFIVVWILGILGFIASTVRFWVSDVQVESQIGPLPTPLGISNFMVLAIVLLRLGEVTSADGVGWTVVRLVGVIFGVYGVIMLPWALGSLKDMALPGAGVLNDHRMVTSGPYEYMRHPLTSALLGLWLGTALGTLNWLLLILWPLFVGFALLGARAEERLLIDKFGDTYKRYKSQTGYFTPRLSS